MSLFVFRVVPLVLSMSSDVVQPHTVCLPISLSHLTWVSSTSSSSQDPVSHDFPCLHMSSAGSERLVWAAITGGRYCFLAPPEPLTIGNAFHYSFNSAVLKSMKYLSGDRDVCFRERHMELDPRYSQDGCQRERVSYSAQCGLAPRSLVHSEATSLALSGTVDS